MRKISALAAGLAAGILSGCVSNSRPPDQIGRQPSASFPVRVNAETEAPDLGALGTAYAMPRGRCGMILYTAASGRSVPVFRSLDDATGVMEIDGELVSLDLVASRGEMRAGQGARQTYHARSRAAGEVVIDVDAVWGTPFPGGTYVERGLVTLTAGDGWRRVLPVAGIAGCKA